MDAHGARPSGRAVVAPFARTSGRPLVYELVHLTMPLLQRHLSNERARVVAVSALAVLVVGLVTAAVTWLVVYLRGEGHLTRLRRSAC